MGENESSVAYSSLERFSNASYLLPKLTPGDSDGGLTGSGDQPHPRLLSDLSDASECFRSAYDRHQVSRSNLITALMDLKDPVLTALANRCLNLTIPDPQSITSSVKEEMPTPSKRRGVVPLLHFSSSRHDRGYRLSATDVDFDTPTANKRVLTAPPARVTSAVAKSPPHPISPPVSRCKINRAKTPPPDISITSRRPPAEVSVNCLSPPPPNQLTWYTKPRGLARKYEDSSPSIGSAKYMTRISRALAAPPPHPSPLTSSPPIPDHKRSGKQTRKFIMSTVASPDFEPTLDRPLTQSTDPTETYVDIRPANVGKAGTQCSNNQYPPAPVIVNVHSASMPTGGAKVREPQTLGKDMNAFAPEGPSRPDHLEYQRADTASVLFFKCNNNADKLAESSKPPINLTDPERLKVNHDQQAPEPNCGPSGSLPACSDPQNLLCAAASGDQAEEAALNQYSSCKASQSRRRETITIRHHQQESPSVLKKGRFVESASPKGPPPSYVVSPIKSAPQASDEGSYVSSETMGVTSIIQRFESCAALKPALPPSKMVPTPADVGKSFREKLDLSNDSFTMTRSGFTSRNLLKKSNEGAETSRPHVETSIKAPAIKHESGCLTARGLIHPPLAASARRKQEILQKVDKKLIDGMTACHTFFDAHTAVKEIAKEAGDLIRLIDSQGNPICPRDIEGSSQSNYSSESSEPTPGLHNTNHSRCFVHGGDPYLRLKQLLASNRIVPKPLPQSSGRYTLSEFLRSFLVQAVPNQEFVGLRDALESGIHRQCTGSPPDIATYTLSHVDTLGILSIVHQQQLLIQTLVHNTLEISELLLECDPNVDQGNRMNGLVTSLKKKLN